MYIAFENLWIDFENLWIYIILKKLYILFRSLGTPWTPSSYFQSTSLSEKKTLKLFYKKRLKKNNFIFHFAINAYKYCIIFELLLKICEFISYWKKLYFIYKSQNTLNTFNLFSEYQSLRKKTLKLFYKKKIKKNKFYFTARY